MSARDFSAIATAREQLRDAFETVDAAAETLDRAGLSELSRDLGIAAGGLKHFAGPDGVMAHVEKGEEG